MSVQISGAGAFQVVGPARAKAWTLDCARRVWGQPGVQVAGLDVLSGREGTVFRDRDRTRTAKDVSKCVKNKPKGLGRWWNLAFTTMGTRRGTRRTDWCPMIRREHWPHALVTGGAGARGQCTCSQCLREVHRDCALEGHSDNFHRVIA